jgi:hypothetical protein
MASIVTPGPGKNLARFSSIILAYLSTMTERSMLRNNFILTVFRNVWVGFQWSLKNIFKIRSSFFFFLIAVVKEIYSYFAPRFLLIVRC